MAQVVIADAGPLIAFAAIDRLPILTALFSGVAIAESVRHEAEIGYRISPELLDSIRAGSFGRPDR